MTTQPTCWWYLSILIQYLELYSSHLQFYSHRKILHSCVIELQNVFYKVNVACSWDCNEASGRFGRLTCRLQFGLKQRPPTSFYLKHSWIEGKRNIQALLARTVSNLREFLMTSCFSKPLVYAIDPCSFTASQLHISVKIVLFML